MELSTSALIDCMVHLTAFLAVCGLLYGFLLLAARSRFERNFFRTVFVVISLVTGRLYLIQGEWAIAPAVVILLLLSVVLLAGVLKTGPIVTIITAFLLAPLLLVMEQTAFTVSRKLISDSITYADFTGQTQSAVVERSRDPEQKEAGDVELQDETRSGPDEVTTLTVAREPESLKHDFSRGASLFAERKAWMDSLTPEEKLAYREELASFLAGQGLADDRYSLSVIRAVNPTNLVMMAGLFDSLQNTETDPDAQIRSIPESLALIAANLRGMELSFEDLETLREFAERIAADEIDAAVAKARSDLEASGGADKLAGLVLTAMLQAKSGLPLDQLMVDDATAAAPAIERAPPPAAAIPPVAVEEEAPVPPEQPEPYVEISCPLGVVLIPPNSPDIEEWIGAAQAVEIRGYAALGNEIALLRKDGSVCVKGDDLALEYGGVRYHFKVISILRNRVALQADFIEVLDGGMSRFQ